MTQGFELQTLLDLRTRERDAVEQTFVEAQRALQEARRTLDAATASRDELSGRIATLRSEPPQLDVFEAQRQTEYIRALEIELDQRQKAQQEARAVAESASELAESRRAELADAEASLEAVERRRDEWFEEQQRRRTQRAEEEREDLALRQWMENKE